MTFESPGAGPVAGDMCQVTTVGNCNGCKRFRKLDEGACGDCRKRFGPRAAEFLRRIRTEPAFAAVCYEQVVDSKKASFIEWFGLPPGCKAV